MISPHLQRTTHPVFRHFYAIEIFVQLVFSGDFCPSSTFLIDSTLTLVPYGYSAAFSLGYPGSKFFAG